MNAFTNEELSRFFAKIKFSSNPPRYEAVFSLALRYAMRIGEVSKIKMNDVDLVNKKISIRGEKNGRQRTYTLSDDLVKLLKTHLRRSEKLGVYLHCFDNKEYLFTNKRGGCLSTHSIWVEFHKICELANIEDKSPHAFRHTAGTTYAMQGKGIAEVANFLRHSNINSSLRYITLRDNYKEDSEMDEVFERMRKGEKK